MFKNTANQKLTVLAFADAGHASLDAGEKVTGDAANITLKIEQDDDGTRSASNDVNPTETEGGQYVFDLTQAETNGDKLTFYPTSSTAGVQVVAVPTMAIYTRPPNFPELGIESDGDLTKVNTLDGHTAQTANHTAAIAALPSQSDITGGAYSLDTDANGRMRVVDGTGVGEIDTDSGRVSLTAATETQIDNIETDTADMQPKLGTVSDLGSGATIADNLGDMAGASFNSATDALEQIRDRGDAAWTTGGGGSISDILNFEPLIPEDIDLADTATWRLALMLTNAVDDLPSTSEITPGTISIDRKAIGGTSWTSVVSDAACSELAGLAYYDEVFDSGTGYAEGDSIRITFKSQKITVAANDYEVSDSNGRMFYTNIRQTERGTDSAYTGTPPTAVQIRQEMDSNSTQLALIVGDTNELQTDWADGGRLDAILDARASQASVDVLPSQSDITGGAYALDTDANGRIRIVDGTGTGEIDTVNGEVIINAFNSSLDFNATMKASTNSEVETALATTTYAEPSSVPAATASLADKIGWVAFVSRNKFTQTATQQIVRNDADSANIGTATISDDGTTFTRGEFA